MYAIFSTWWHVSVFDILKQNKINKKHDKYNDHFIKAKM